eukprot:6194833-Pyramimonas_sp.AAC.1
MPGGGTNRRLRGKSIYLEDAARGGVEDGLLEVVVLDAQVGHVLLERPRREGLRHRVHCRRGNLEPPLGGGLALRYGDAHVLEGVGRV